MKKRILEEETYVEALEQIIQRDFYPGIINFYYNIFFKKKRFTKIKNSIRMDGSRRIW